LAKKGRPLTPSELFHAAGFTPETVDEFFLELRSELNQRVRQEWRSQTPVKKDALLSLIPDAVSDNGAGQSLPETSP